VISQVAWKKRDGCERCALWWPEQCPLALSHAPRWFFVGKNKCRIGRGGTKGTGGSSMQEGVSFRVSEFARWQRGSCSTSHRVECQLWEQHGGELVNMDRCLTTASQPKTGGQNRKGRARWHWRAFPNTTREPEPIMRVPSHFPLTTVSRVSPFSLGPRLFPFTRPSVADRGLHLRFTTTRSPHLWAE
jgi:hypothetical protein